LAQNVVSAVSPLIHLQPSSLQGELIALGHRLARERFAPRADRHASFPLDDYTDLRTEGLFGLCVPERYGGLGADYETYCLVAEQLAQGNASTALTFNMHCLTMLMMGPIADNMAMPPAVRERHEQLRAAKFREVVEEGAFYGQPYSEPVEQGETDTKLGVGGRRFGTTARKVDGGYVVNGRKFFVSLAGCAPYYATPAIRLGDEPWSERTLAYLIGRMPGAPVPYTEIAAKGRAIAEMLFSIESARAIYYRAISEARVDAPLAAVQRARAAHVTVQRTVVAVTQEAIRVCGGRAFLRRYPLERYARDARAAALMRPWTEEIAMQQAWEAALGLDEQRGGAAGA
jgi:alkylation response protein AidB-like acyl-CoA dehydrogenase